MGTTRLIKICDSLVTLHRTPGRELTRWHQRLAERPSVRWSTVASRSLDDRRARSDFLAIHVVERTFPVRTSDDAVVYDEAEFCYPRAGRTRIHDR